MKYRVSIYHHDPLKIQQHYDEIKDVKSNIKYIDEYNLTYDDEYQNFMTREQYYEMKEENFHIFYHLIPHCEGCLK